MTTNKKRIAEFNALYDAGKVKSVCADIYPSLGGYRATFYREQGAATGWLIATDSTGPASNTDNAFRVPEALVDAAAAIKLDPYDGAGYAKALLDLSDEFRAE